MWILGRTRVYINERRGWEEKMYILETPTFFFDVYPYNVWFRYSDSFRYYSIVPIARIATIHLHKSLHGV